MNKTKVFKEGRDSKVSSTFKLFYSPHTNNQPFFFFEGDNLSEELLTSENSGKVSISKKAVIKIGMKIENFILIFLSLKAYNIEVLQSF